MPTAAASYPPQACLARVITAKLNIGAGFQCTALQENKLDAETVVELKDLKSFLCCNSYFLSPNQSSGVVL